MKKYDRKYLKYNYTSYSYICDFKSLKGMIFIWTTRELIY